MAPRPTIGMLIGWIGRSYFNEVLSATADAASERGCDLVCFAGAMLARPAEGTPWEAGLELAGAENADALLFAVARNVDDPTPIARVIDRYRSLPLCTIGSALGESPNVQVDNRSAVRDAVTHLIRVHGRRRVAVVQGPAANQEAQLRYAGYLDALAASGLLLVPALATQGDFTPEGGARGARALLDAGVPFDAVVAPNDSAALGVLEVLAAHGRRVPEDVSVLGFDDSEDAWAARPSLTTIRQPYRELALRALDYLLGELGGQRLPPHALLSPALVLRRSCGCQPDLYRATVSDESATPVAAPAPSRAALADEWRRMLAALNRPPPDGWQDLLLDAFAAELAGASGEFIAGFQRLLDASFSDLTEAAPWHNLLSALRRQVVPALAATPAARARAEDLLHQARIAVSETASRWERAQRHALDSSVRRLTAATKAIVESFNLDVLCEVLPRELGALGVESYWLSLYDPPGAVGPWSCLHLARRAGEAPVVLAPPRRFPTRDLVPRDLRPDVPAAATPRAWVVEPLYYHREQIGTLILELNARAALIYDVLREQVSAALQGAVLVRRVAEEAALRERADKLRLERELEIAARLQTSILPKTFAVDGLEIAAVLVPASEVGGDYFDVLPVPGGCYLGIGDVAGHGLTAGILMTMLQSGLASLKALDHELPPARMFRAANAALFDNIRRRLGRDEHITLTLFRYRDSGELSFVGCHEDLLVCRAATGDVDVVETRGAWLGVKADVPVVEQFLKLGPGDVLLLHTDGVTEARNADDEFFGLERLSAGLRRLHQLPAAAIRDGLLDAVRSWLVRQDDDIALVVAKQRG